MAEVIQEKDTNLDIEDSKSSYIKEEVYKPKTIRMSRKTDFSIKLASQVEDCNMGELVQKAVDAFIAERHPELTRIIDKY